LHKDYTDLKIELIMAGETSGRGMRRKGILMATNEAPD